ncbi:hypothetical protein [Mesorhizobium sp.]|uniref:SH3 domain-containing protein n=1 Tax=Mesorhizobium sp. TaxID=1871066 RepID=UPI0025F5F53F|nr:hypothetical protein [Mesorhizobium sp.]
MAEEMAQEAPELVISVVTGLAPDDLLKVRTTASPVATVEARLSSGDMVTNLGCNDINGYKWCKVESTGKEKLSGWAPARYLIPLNPAPYVEGETRPADAPVVASTGSANETGQSSAPDQSHATGPANSAPVAPPDLTARLGGAGPAAESRRGHARHRLRRRPAGQLRRAQQFPLHSGGQPQHDPHRRGRAV